MATPTVEMGLGGSLRSLAASYSTGYWFSSMRAAANITVVVSPGVLLKLAGKPLATSLSNGWISAPEWMNASTGASINNPGELPEGESSVDLDGVTGYLSADFTAMGTSAGTLEAVVRIDSTPGVGVEPLIWGTEDFGITYRNDGRVYAYYNGSAVTSIALATGGVAHIALTRAGSATDSITLYVNGTSSTATPARVSLADTTWQCGKHWTDAEYLDGRVYFLSAYDVALSSGQVAANYAAVSWTDVTNDTKGVTPLIIERGIRSDSPAQRVASTGTCTFAMNNLASNSGGVTGYYSPGNASCRAGFGKGTPVRVKQGSDTLFSGRIRKIEPTPGKTGGNLSQVLATDYIDTAATFLLENAAILEDVRADEVFATVVGLMTNQPSGIITYQGTETYTLALDNTRDEAVTALSEFHRLAVSELGYIYVLGDGRLVFEARGTRMTNEPTATVTLADTMHGLDVAEVSSSSLNRVQITVHPRVIDTAATTVLFALTNPLQIAAGETKTIIGPYRTASSPGITTRVGGLQMVTPVASTDYVMNAESDGTGTDLTASLDVTANYGANGVQFILTNNDAQPAYITTLQCRGKGVYDFRTVVVRAQNDAAVAADGVNALTLDMPYQEDPNVAQSMADSILSSYGDLAGTRVQKVEFYPDAAGMPSNLHQNDISDRVAVSETVTGATGEYYINGVKHEYQWGKLPRITWWLTPAEPVSYWILGLAGASELGDTTVLAPG